MIGKMILQGLAAAVVIAGAAGVYAANAGVGQAQQSGDGGAAAMPRQSPDTGYLAPRDRWFGPARTGHDRDDHDDHDRRDRSAKAFPQPAAGTDNGYLVPPQTDRHEGRRGKRHDD